MYHFTSNQLFFWCYIMLAYSVPKSWLILRLVAPKKPKESVGQSPGFQYKLGYQSGHTMIWWNPSRKGPFVFISTQILQFTDMAQTANNIHYNGRSYLVISNDPPNPHKPSREVQVHKSSLNTLGFVQFVFNVAFGFNVANHHYLHHRGDYVSLFPRSKSVNSTNHSKYWFNDLKRL